MKSVVAKTKLVSVLVALMTLLALAQTDEPAEKTILAIGDSYVKGDTGFSVQGHANTIRGGWVRRLSWLLDEAFPEQYKVINKGVNGDMAPALLDRLDRDAIRLKPDIIFLQLHIDGFLTTTEDYKTVIQEIVTTLVGELPDVNVILVGYPTPLKRYVDESWFSSMFEDYTQEDLELMYLAYNETLRQIATEQGLMLVDVFAAWPQDEQESWELLADGFHFNDAGHELVADMAYRTLVDLR